MVAGVRTDIVPQPYHTVQQVSGRTLYHGCTTVYSMCEGGHCTTAVPRCTAGVRVDNVPRGTAARTVCVRTAIVPQVYCSVLCTAGWPLYWSWHFAIAVGKRACSRMHPGCDKTGWLPLATMFQPSYKVWQPLWYPPRHDRGLRDGDSLAVYAAS